MVLITFRYEKPNISCFSRKRGGVFYPDKKIKIAYKAINSSILCLGDHHLGQDSCQEHYLHMSNYQKHDFGRYF